MILTGCGSGAAGAVEELSERVAGTCSKIIQIYVILYIFLKSQISRDCHMVFFKKSNLLSISDK